VLEYQLQLGFSPGANSPTKVGTLNAVSGSCASFSVF
jgi:hypothetical protein